MNEVDFPEGPWCLLDQLPEADLLVHFFDIDPVVMSVGLGIVFLNVEDRPETGNQQHRSGTEVGPDNSLRDHSPLRRVGHPKCGEDEWQNRSKNRTTIREDLLPGPGGVLLLVVNHVPD